MNTVDYINKYFEGTLSEEELKTFNTLIINDNKFKDAVNFEKELRHTLVLNDREELKQEIQNWDTDSNNRSFKPWLIAASILILLGTSWQLFFNSPSSTAEELYASYFEPYRNIVQPIVRGETKTDLKTNAFTAYETKSYTEALQYFNELLKESPDETIAFYKANVLLKLNRTEDAIAILKNNLKSTDSLDVQNNWYLALAYLKLDTIEKAKEQLKIVSSNPLGNYKKDEVKKILRQLE